MPDVTHSLPVITLNVNRQTLQLKGRDWQNALKKIDSNYMLYTRDTHYIQIHK